jgi:type I restriction enzyme, S subunit
MNVLMKDSYVEWIGDVPENWTKDKLFRITDFVSSGGTPTSTNPDYYGGDIIWIQTGDLNDSYITKTSKKITQYGLDNSSAKIFDAGTLLIAMYGATIGKLGIMTKNAATNQACCAMKYNKKIDTKYMYYVFFAMRTHLINQSYGGGQPNISQEVIKQQYLTFPKKTEQKQIADFLDKATLQIEDAIKTKEKQLKTLEALKKSIIHKAVTKGLDDSVEMIDSKIEWIGNIPKHWDTKMIKRFAQVKRGASPRPIADQKYFDEDGEFAWVRIADVTASDRYLENTTQRLSELGSQYSVKQYPNDLFISIAGTVGKPIISKIKCCIHDGFVWFDNITFNKEYLYYIFYAGLPYGGLGKLGTQLNLNTDTIGKIYIPVVPKDELPKIVEYLDIEVEKINTLKVNVKKQIDKLKEYKKSLIYEYVTGKKQIKG